MDFLKKFAESTTETTDKPAPSDQQSNLFSSAKLVADAARSNFQNEPDKKYDTAEVAGAAADLLDAAQSYGKLDKTSGVGSYVEKAENYLHEYEASHSTKPKTSEEPKSSAEKEVEKPSESTKPTSEESKPEKEEEPATEMPKPSAEKEEVEEPSESAVKPTTEEPKKEEEPSELAKPSADSEEKTSGLGGYAKIAEGFLKKDGDSGEGDEKGGAGVGDYVKLAEGFLNKPSEGSKPDADESSNAGGNLLKFAGGFLGKN